MLGSMTEDIAWQLPEISGAPFSGGGLNVSMQHFTEKEEWMREKQREERPWPQSACGERGPGVSESRCCCANENPAARLGRSGGRQVS